jgi:hypothetical protein
VVIYLRLFCRNLKKGVCSFAMKLIQRTENVKSLAEQAFLQKEKG